MGKEALLQRREPACETEIRYFSAITYLRNRSSYIVSARRYPLPQVTCTASKLTHYNAVSVKKLCLFTTSNAVSHEASVRKAAKRKEY